tara:strand:- start:213 stop:407 length:195 start_codon:yes stop_codon:yes gene_type:complete
MSDLSVTDADTLVILKELVSRTNNNQDKMFKVNAVKVREDTLMITNINVIQPLYIKNPDAGEEE